MVCNEYQGSVQERAQENLKDFYKAKTLRPMENSPPQAENCQGLYNAKTFKSKEISPPQAENFQGVYSAKTLKSKEISPPQAENLGVSPQIFEFWNQLKGTN